jgi:hypothetical protein
VSTPLRQFSKWWKREVETRPEIPSFRRVWGVARCERDRILADVVDDDELLGLAAMTFLDCVRRFDEEHPPTHGLPRMTSQDRLVYFFGRSLKWKLHDLHRELRRQRPPRRGDSRFRGPRGDKYGAARQPRSRTALLETVERGVACLDEHERALIDLRYWDAETLDDVAGKVGYTNRFRAKRELDRVHHKLRGVFLDEVEDAAMSSEDDYGILAA